MRSALLGWSGCLVYLATLSFWLRSGQRGASLHQGRQQPRRRVHDRRRWVDERAAMETMAKDFNLKLVFASRIGRTWQTSNVEIKDSGGAGSSRPQSNGPWSSPSADGGLHRHGNPWLERRQMKKVNVGEGLGDARPSLRKTSSCGAPFPQRDAVAIRS